MILSVFTFLNLLISDKWYPILAEVTHQIYSINVYVMNHQVFKKNY